MCGHSANLGTLTKGKVITSQDARYERSPSCSEKSRAYDLRYSVLDRNPGNKISEQLLDTASKSSVFKVETVCTYLIWERDKTHRSELRPNSLRGVKTTCRRDLSNSCQAVIWVWTKVILRYIVRQISIPMRSKVDYCTIRPALFSWRKNRAAARDLWDAQNQNITHALRWGEAPLQLLDSNLYPPSVGGTNSWLRTWTLDGPEKHMQQRLFAQEQKTKEVRPCRFCPSKFHNILSIIHLRTKQTSIWRCKEEGLGSQPQCEINLINRARASQTASLLVWVPARNQEGEIKYPIGIRFPCIYKWITQLGDESC